MTKLTCWPTLKLRGQLVPRLRVRTMPQHECIRAVAIALHSWCLIKLSRCLLLQNFDLALETIGNGAFVEIVGGWLSPPSTCCTVAIAVLHHAGWSYAAVCLLRCDLLQRNNEHCTSSLPEIEDIPRKFVYARNQIISRLEYGLSWQWLRETENAWC